MKFGIFLLSSNISVAPSTKQTCFPCWLCFCSFDKEQHDAFFLWSSVSSVIPYLCKNTLLYNNDTFSVVTAHAQQTTAEFLQVILLLLCPTKQFSCPTVL